MDISSKVDDQSAEVKNTTVRTRYAPSPTGELHIGGARTALFNYLFAKHHNGKFVLRIEDTDVERNVENNEFEQENNLKKLNIFPDESFSNPGNYGPYLQSQKEQRYLDLAEKLLQNNKAYRCFCQSHELDLARKTALNNNSTPIYSKKCRHLTSEEIQDKLDKNIPYTIRIKTDLNPNYSWEDMVRGVITVPSNALGDFIIMRSSKKATYNFAVVIDDYDMKINHILRGEEHISNTPYQLAVYSALDIEDSIPKFGHISMIVDENRNKLSKRNGKDYHFVSYFLKKGYPTEALFNFLALLSWSHEEEEIYSIEELIKLFNVSEISSSPTVFDLEKLNWISHKYFQKMDENYYLNFIKSFFDVDLKENNDKKIQFALLSKTRISCADELNTLAKEFFETTNQLNQEQLKFLKQNYKLLELAVKNFPTEEEWDLTTIRNYLKQLMEISTLKGLSFFKPLRIAFSFCEDGFAIQDLLYMLGRQKTINNLKIVMEEMEKI